MDVTNLHEILKELYTEMMPLCEDMADMAKGLAGLGALFYIAMRVWSSLARAEPIDAYPLLRPFALGICILFFPTIVLGCINGLLSPIAEGCHSIVESQSFDLQKYKQERDRLEYEALMRNPETAYLASDEEFDRQLDELGWSPADLATMAGMYYNRTMHSMKRSVADGFRSLLEMLFEAAGLIIDTIRTFFLVVLSILGPVVFAFASWEGLQSSLAVWISRYISVYLWLPVSDIFSAMLTKIQILMMQSDIKALQDPEFVPDMNNTVYIVFLLIGIIGFFTVPTVAGWIVDAGGGVGNYGRNINSSSQAAGHGALVGGKGAAAGTGAAVGNIGGRIKGALIK